MPAGSDRATYNLKAVVQETGVKADTLRAWERRYGLPRPKRTAGGHRLFSQRDIDTVLWLKARLMEGMSISRAVGLWRSLESDGQDPLIALPAVSGAEALPYPRLQGKALEQARQSWLEACLRFQEDQAEAQISLALAQYPAEVVAVEVLGSGLAEIGELWYRGEATVHQEHFASALATRRLQALLAASSPAAMPGTVLVGAAPDDLHAFAPLLMTFLLRRRGRRAVFLGADIPLSRFEAAIEQLQPDLLILTAQRLPTAANLAPFGDLLAERSIPFAFAGGVFSRHPGLRERIRGHFLGAEFPGALKAAEDMLAGSPGTPMEIPVDKSHQKALRAFRETHTEIENQLRQALGPKFPAAHLDQALIFLGEDIEASLALGFLDALPAEIEWVYGLLKARGLETDDLRQFVAAYLESLENTIGPAAEPILSSLVTIVDGRSKSNPMVEKAGGEA